ncbi:aminoglycoside phosphotransferase family protein [candidate division KSB1 bacterium]|nr:aminoglycoside phosphotransferase family protein [candidate division KSB1 bacterium]
MKRYSVPPEKAEALVRYRMKIGNIALQLRPAGTGRFSTTYFVDTPRGMDDLVIRIAPPDDLLLLFYEKRMMRQEPALHRLIRRNTTMPIPTILSYDFSRTQIDRDYLIMNRMPGRSLAEMRQRLTPGQMHRVLFEWGQAIAQLHRIKAKRYGYIGAHHPMEPQIRWDAAFEIMWANMLNDCVNCGVYSEDQRKLGLDLFQQYQNAFDTNCPSVLCHMDLWVENVLVDDDGHVSCVFDFDRACFGDAENEFAVAEYCGITKPAFWDGYGTQPERTREWAIRRWFYLLYEHQKYIVIRVSDRHNDMAGALNYALQCVESMKNFARSGQPIF